MLNFDEVVRIQIIYFKETVFMRADRVLKNVNVNRNSENIAVSHNIKTEAFREIRDICLVLSTKI